MKFQYDCEIGVDTEGLVTLVVAALVDASVNKEPVAVLLTAVPTAEIVKIKEGVRAAVPPDVSYEKVSNDTEVVFFIQR